MPRSLVEAGSTKIVSSVNTVDVVANTIVSNMTEKVVIHNTRPNGLVEIDISRGTIHYFKQNATGNFNFNFRTSATPVSGDIISTGQGVTVAILITNGASAYFPTDFLIDGVSIGTNIIWNGVNGSPSQGTANSIDTFTFTFVNGLDGLKILASAKSTGGVPGAGPTGPLFSFTSATFGTNTSGPNGPDYSGALSSLSVSGDSSWTTNTEYFNVQSGFQFFTIPETGNYRITVAGAQGGDSNCWGTPGGLGAQMRGDFALDQGTVLKMVVGQRGSNDCYDGSGGGGSYVCLNDNTPVIIAGGGGGNAPNNNSHRHGTTSTSGQSASSSGGSNGSGGAGSTAGGGGGLTGNGGGSWGGRSFTNGATGGPGYSPGFGGGGGGGGTNGAGGGGGYSGGSYSGWSGAGGGGGSFNNGSNQSNSSASRSGNGFISIEKI